MRTFVLTDDTSNKFWNIDLQGARYLVTFGKVGARGQTQVKDFRDEAAARAAHDKVVAEKLAKGYVETTPLARPAATPLQQSLEAALAEAPDDLAARAAHADYLMEQGDPRGEFIQVQLALEDEGRPAKERAALRKREAELLKAHAAAWVGDAGRFLVGKWSGPDKPWHYQFARGWLDFARLLPFPAPVLTTLARSPEARLLRRLEVVYDMRYHPWDFHEFTQGPEKALKEAEADDREPGARAAVVGTLARVVASPYLTNLRALKIGFSDFEDHIGHSTMVPVFSDFDVKQVLALLERCPRLEELYLNSELPGIERLFASPALHNLRVLQYYYGNDYSNYDGKNPTAGYPLKALAKNKAAGRLDTLRLIPGREMTIGLEDVEAVLRSKHLASLRHLQVRMTTFGDAGAHAVVASGALRRLKVLDLGYGNMTDAGARALADCIDLDNLQTLDVSRNALTARGIKALRARGITVIAGDQHDSGEEDYLFSVDYE